jgi:uncharacterized protein (UPF0333 family)
MRRQRAQSTLEYIVVFAAIVAVVIWAAKTIIYPAINKGLENTENVITNAANKL